MQIEIIEQENGTFTIKFGTQVINGLSRGHMVRLRNSLNVEINKL